MSRVYVAYDPATDEFLTKDGEFTEHEAAAGQWRNPDVLRQIIRDNDPGAEGLQIIPRRARDGKFVDRGMP